jgi:hypothetical protein
MTSEQRQLLVKLQEVFNRERWSGLDWMIAVTAGPRAFEARCHSGDRTLWHWVGTSDQILNGLEGWMRQRRRTHPAEFIVPNSNSQMRASSGTVK